MGHGRDEMKTESQHGTFIAHIRHITIGLLYLCVFVCIYIYEYEYDMKHINTYIKILKSDSDSRKVHNSKASLHSVSYSFPSEWLE